jgi:Serine dehydrogenase proteinase
MPNWNEILTEIEGLNKGPHDLTRLKYLEKLHEHTKRNVLVYYSGWLQKPQIRGADFSINDADKTGFMTCSHAVNRDLGLDIVLHTPGGDVAATESLIHYLHSLYDGNIRAIIPQMAMSGGTLMALSCKEIIMGRQSSIGPVDPQIGGMPAQGILEEFKQAGEEISKNKDLIPLWQPIIAKYWPTLITSCQHAIDWSDKLLKTFLTDCMFKDTAAVERDNKIAEIANLLGKQSTSKSHNRHIGQEQAIDLGLNVIKLEDDPLLQDIVLSLHHALTITFAQTPTAKIIENHKGVAYVQQAATF